MFSCMLRQDGAKILFQGTWNVGQSRNLWLLCKFSGLHCLEHVFCIRAKAFSFRTTSSDSESVVKFGPDSEYSTSFFTPNHAYKKAIVVSKFLI